MSNWFADKLGPAPRVNTGLGGAKPAQEPPRGAPQQQARAPEPPRQQAAAPQPKAAPAPAPKVEEPPKKKKGWF
jgi:hypothetical protein